MLGPYLHDNLKSLTSKYLTDKCVEPNDVIRYFGCRDVSCLLLPHPTTSEYGDVLHFLRKGKCERLTK
jgi:hypothetical protein